MDKKQEAASLIVFLNQYKNGKIKDHELLPKVCDYFDAIKKDAVSQADLQFLKYISNIIGIPHYFDLLSKLGHDIAIEDIKLGTFASIFYESSLHTNDTDKLHKYQKEILNKFQPDQLNRFFLSASTSFGKTYIVYEIIKKMKYKNIVLVFPTIALLSENLEKLISNKEFSDYKKHTLSEVPKSDIGEKNIFIYTPERFLSFIEKPNQNIEFDFVFVDEVYKIDNEYIIDDQTKEDERDVSYRIATFYALLKNADSLLAGPYIESYSKSFQAFLKDKDFKILDYNKYEIVNKSRTDIKSKKKVDIDGVLTFTFTANTKEGRLQEIVTVINAANENCIIYCSSPASVERYAKKLLESQLHKELSEYSSFISHLEKEYNSEWVVIKALKQGIGIHHGLVPKYIQKEIVNLFNKGFIRVLLSTTTITEGVNTSAKNVVVLSDHKGKKILKHFDAKNIAGRAGRFLYHYKGRVIVLKNKFEDIINQDSEEIKHKNYDLEAPKDEVDIFYSKDEFLNDADIKKKENIFLEQAKRGIPDEIINQYKIISKSDKIKIYDDIVGLSSSQLAQIRVLISAINMPKVGIDSAGFQLIIDMLKPIIKNPNLEFIVETKCRQGTSPYSILTACVSNYLSGGFKGLVDYYITTGNDIDDATRKTAKFVYNTLKYQTVKYIGIFNVLYKFIMSERAKKPIEEISGIDRLLLKLEYNALTPDGRKVSDYGVPSKILEYYESLEIDNDISLLNKVIFDPYEQIVFEKVDKIIKNSQ